MKKLVICMAAMAMMGMMMTSCQKEEESSTTEFTAYTETPEAKTNLGTNNQMVWEVGDEVAVYHYQYGKQATIGHTFRVDRIYGNGSAVLKQIPDENADFTTGGTQHEYWALYPAAATQSFNQIHPSDIPLRTQQYRENGMNHFPMYAHHPRGEETSSLKFYNMCGVLRLSLQDADLHIKKITVTTPNYTIPNTYSVSTSEGPYSIDASYNEGQNSSYTLNCDNIDIATTKDFNIILPCCSNGYPSMKIKIETQEGGYWESTANAPLPIVRNTISIFSLSNLSNTTNWHGSL